MKRGKISRKDYCNKCLYRENYDEKKSVQTTFKLEERSGIDLVTVFQQERTDDRKFEKKGKVVYKRQLDVDKINECNILLRTVIIDRI